MTNNTKSGFDTKEKCSRAEAIAVLAHAAHEWVNEIETYILWDPLVLDDPDTVEAREHEAAAIKRALAFLAHGN